MDLNKTHVYFVPGLAAGKEIFKNIHLPEDKFEIHILEWLIPEINETIIDYSKRMAAEIKFPASILIGVSFGGVVVQEMSAFLNLKKLIIISSVKTRFELPARLKFARKTKAYKLIPTGLVVSMGDLTRLAIGPKSAKRLKLYQEYLHVRDKNYLDWAIKNMVHWNRTEEVAGLVHIHGDMDAVFPLKNIQNCEIIKGGTHVMLLTKGKEISEKLFQILSA